MLTNDLFNTDYERRLSEGAVDRLEARRIDDLNMKLDDLVQRAKAAKDPAHKEALAREFRKFKAERDSYFGINPKTGEHPSGLLGTTKGALDEAGIGQDIVNKQEKMARATPSTPTSKVVSTAKNAAKWLAGKGGPGKEGPTYESTQKKNSEEVEEGWSNKMVAQRTGTAPTPYPAYIKRKEWTSFADDDHAENVANKLRAKFKQEGKDPSVITIAPTGYDKDLKEFAPSPERSDDDVPNQILTLANRWWNATDKQPQIANVLRSLGWSINQVESEDDAVQLMHNDGTTYFISADEFDPDLHEDIGGWIVYDPATKQIKKRFKTHTAGKSYAKTHGLGFASSEYYFDRVKEPATESATAPIVVMKRRKKEKQPKKFHIPYTADDYVPPAVQLARDEEAKKKGIEEDSSDYKNIIRRVMSRVHVDGGGGNLGYMIELRAPTMDMLRQVYHDDIERMLDKAHPNELKKAAQELMAMFSKEPATEGIVASGPSQPLDDRAIRKLVWDTMKINADTGEQALQRALTVLAKKPQSRMVQDLQDKFQSLSTRLNQPVAETVTDVRAGMADIYRRLAPKIERHRDSFLAGQLYDELENYAELHGAESEFKRMLAGARNRAHMDYDTNPGGFHNWFWYLPFADEVDEGYHASTIDAMSQYAYEPKVGDAIWVRDGKGGKVHGQVVELRPGIVVFTADDNKRYRIPVGRVVRDLEESNVLENNDARDAVESAIIRRILVSRTDLLEKFGPDKTMEAAAAVADENSDVEEIGSSDVSAFVQQVERYLAMNY